MTGVEGEGGLSHRHLPGQKRLGEESALLGDLPDGADEGADARVGRPHQGAAVFHRPEDRHGQVLVGRAGPAATGATTWR